MDAAYRYPYVDVSGLVNHHTYYIRPLTDIAAALIALVLERHSDNVSAFVCTMHLPGCTKKQDVFAVRHAIMVEIKTIRWIRTDFVAYVQYSHTGEVHRYDTQVMTP